jgi:hypothetical protein
MTRALKHLTTVKTGLKYRLFVEKSWVASLDAKMDPIRRTPISKHPSAPPDGAKPCTHPRVRVVAREEDSEFVECQECGDVFESSEFNDMAIEEDIRPEDL